MPAFITSVQEQIKLQRVTGTVPAQIIYVLTFVNRELDIKSVFWGGLFRERASSQGKERLVP